jgi:hypothetical protein
LGAVETATQALTHGVGENRVKKPATDQLCCCDGRGVDPPRSAPKPADLEHEVLKLKIGKRPIERHLLAVTGRRSDYLSPVAITGTGEQYIEIKILRPWHVSPSQNCAHSSR